jgi:hypothetical protein
MKTQTISPGRAFLLCLSVVLSLHSHTSRAQQPTEITPMVSWSSGGSASVANGTVRYESGMGYGLTASQGVEKNVSVELSYVLFPTRGHFDPATGSSASPVTMDFTIHYLQFGAAYHALVEAFQPYLSTTCGVVWFRPGESKYSGDWRLAFSTLVGLKLLVTDNIGFRVQGRVLFPVYFSGGGLWSGVEGTGSGFKNGIRVVRADLAVGLIASF